MKELLILTGIGIFAMFAEIFNLKKLIFPAVLTGLLATISCCVQDWGGDDEVLFGMAIMDNFALAFTGLMCSIAALWFSFANGYLRDSNSESDQYAVLVFALVGALMMVSYTNLSMLFIGIEILSIAMFILAGSRKYDIASNESAFKYFLLGAFASGFLLLGITLLYGATGSFDIGRIAAALLDPSVATSPLITVSVLMLIVGMGFKISAAPFHFWAPDVYQGAPTLITSFMATIVKTAAIAAFFRLFIVCMVNCKVAWQDILFAMAILTLLLSNITAVMQQNAKRMLAYSSISHAGYMLIALMSLSAVSGVNILYYATAYSLASVAAFGVIYLVQNRHNATGDVSDFNGLAKQYPFLAGIMTIVLLSLAGIPPMAGFFAKYFIFADALAEGHILLVLVAVLASLVGIYYYLKIVIAMYFQDPPSDAPIYMSDWHKATLLVAAIATILVGLFPNSIITLFS